MTTVMLRLEIHDCCFTLTLSSELPLVDLVSHLLADLLVYERLGSLPGLIIVSRELLRNAVIHGNGGDAERQVEYRLDWRDASRFTVTVSDEGDGFDHEHDCPRAPVNPQRLVGRGYALISSCAERIEFARGGATVTAYLGKQGVDARGSPTCR